MTPRILVVRAAHQSDRLSTRLIAQGFTPVVVPVIEMFPPPDNGTALQGALQHEYDWVVYTSSNAVAAVGVYGSVTALRTAVVGPGTAEAVRRRGGGVDLEARISTADGLLADLLHVPPTSVLLPLAAGASVVLADGLRAAGWDVTAVPAYQTLPRGPKPSELADARSCDAVLFTSSSSVTSWLAVCSLADTPPIVVSIGPQTSSTARENGLLVAREAFPHTLDGLVGATVEALRITR
jgi:uroporphyrinogen-III synthase